MVALSLIIRKGEVVYYLIEHYEEDTFVGIHNTIDEVKAKIIEYAEEQEEFNPIKLDKNFKLIPKNRFVVIRGTELIVDVVENKLPKFSVTIKEK